MCFPAFLRIYFDNTVLLKQSAYINREVFLGKYCDVSSYKLLLEPLTTLALLFTSRDLLVSTGPFACRVLGCFAHV